MFWQLHEFQIDLFIFEKIWLDLFEMLSFLGHTQWHSMPQDTTCFYERDTTQRFWLTSATPSVDFSCEWDRDVVQNDTQVVTSFSSFSSNAVLLTKRSPNSLEWRTDPLKHFHCRRRICLNIGVSWSIVASWSALFLTTMHQTADLTDRCSWLQKFWVHNL